jgi:predicted nucleic acid-binding protein
VLIVADAGAIIALIDADARHHSQLLELYDADPDSWVLPWAILPEVDYLLETRRAQQRFSADLTDGVFRLEWGQDSDFARAQELRPPVSRAEAGPRRCDRDGHVRKAGRRRDRDL